MYEVVIGRKEKELEELGKTGSIFLGKSYVKMGQTSSLANNIYMDVSRAHVVFVCGKRGGGKSYTMGVIAEGLADLPPEIASNLSFILLDTMGIYWTMKYPNYKDAKLLEQWGLKGKGLDVKIYTPYRYFERYRKEGMPTDVPFSVNAAELNADDWCITFGISPTSETGVLLERVIYAMKGDDERREMRYSIKDIIKNVQKDADAKKEVKEAVVNLFQSTTAWGVFSEDGKGTPLSELAKPGQISVLDVSCYATSSAGWKVKSIIIGLAAQKLFIERMLSRKAEEFQEIHKSTHYFTDIKEQKKEEKMPLVWLVIDEAHEFLPRDEKTVATNPLVTILREGRQPGISLILASQQPGKIHTDVMTQTDIFISHRITAKIDTEALGALMQSYLRDSLDKLLEDLPRVEGAALVLDDNNERIYPMRIRPRFTWHGGEDPSAIPKKKSGIGFKA